MPKREVIRVDVLISALRIHKYEYSGLSLINKIKGVDFRKISPKTTRVMNRLTKLILQYQDKYQQEARAGVVVTVSQIVHALFKSDIEKVSITRPAASSMSGMALAT